MNINDRTNSFDTDDINQNKVISALSYFGILFFLPLVACPNSRFGRFHANQGLILLILSAISGMLNIVPIIGGLLSSVAGIAVFILFLFGLINTLNGFAKELPFVGNISIIK
ncbi:MAG: hypothetical protein PHZ09_01130 [Eubacteriales bacterium]|jgi:uncharacterized membrane protein|nr:hypothetical protein [Eubacteriales bacterium]